MYGCREKIRRVSFWRPDLRLVAVLSILTLILLLIPLIRLTAYAVPWYDGYNFGRYVKNFLDEEYSLRSALRGAAVCVKSEWYAWQGAYTATFFSALMPAVWGEEYYFLGPLFIILILPVSVCVLMKTLMRDVLKADMASCVIVQSVAAAIAVVLIHSPQEGFYWYVGGSCYVGVHSFLMLLTAAWIKLLTGRRKTSAALLFIGALAGAALVAGSTYVTALQGILIGLSIVALGVLLRNKRVLLLLPSLAVYAYGFYKSASAPGNQVRKAILAETGMGMDAVSAIAASFVEAFRHMGEFTDGLMLVMMIFLLPVIWNIVRKTNVRFRYPGILLLWSFCLYAAGFTPCLYSLGYAGPERALNVTKLTYQMLLLVNEGYWLGWLYGKLRQTGEAALFGWQWEKKRESSASGKNMPVVFYAVIVLLTLGLGVIEPDKEGSFSSYCAYHYVHTGEAYNFHQEYLKRVEAIKNGGDVVVVEPYHFKPWIIFMGELSEDADSGPNSAIANFYDKRAVMLRKQ